MQEKLESGQAMPQIRLPTTSDEDTVTLGGKDRWQLVVIYRGKHCPLCRTYLDQLNELKPAFDAIEVEIAAVSADPIEKAQAQVEEQGLGFHVGHGLSVPQMRELGLYVSDPRTPSETDRPYAEPGVFLVNPEGRVHIVEISSAPFARADLEALLRGITYIKNSEYPVRGNA